MKYKSKLYVKGDFGYQFNTPYVTITIDHIVNGDSVYNSGSILVQLHDVDYFA